MARNLTPQQEKDLGLSDEFQRNLDTFTGSLSTTVAGSPEADKRLLAVARTQFELGFMALNKAIANPANKISTERGPQ